MAQGNVTAQYTYGLGLISQVNAAGGSAYYNFDLTGNTTQLTGAGGSVVDSYSFLPFGDLLSSTDKEPQPVHVRRTVRGHRRGERAVLHKFAIGFTTRR